MTSTIRSIRIGITTAALALSIAPVANASTARAASDDRAAMVCPPVARTGTYRIEISREGKEPTAALLVLERAAGCLSALLVTDQGASPLEITAVSDSSITGNLRVARRDAVISLRFDATRVSGEVTHEKKLYRVTGQSTS